MTYYIYILESELDGSFYIGQTKNIQNRLKIHNAGYSTYTKNKRPWKIIFSSECTTRSVAMALEKKLKGLKKRVLILKYISDNSTRII